MLPLGSQAFNSRKMRTAAGLSQDLTTDASDRCCKARCGKLLYFHDFSVHLLVLVIRSFE